MEKHNIRVGLVVIGDRSGSMYVNGRIVEARTGINRFVEDQKKEPGEVMLTVVVFDDQMETVIEDKPLGEFQPLTEENYFPRGMTRLLDAIGLTVTQQGERFEQMPADRRPEKVIVAVYTDGIENASVKYTSKRIAEILKHQREKYSWEFLFVGTDEKTVKQAQKQWGFTMSAQTLDTGKGTMDAYAATSKMISSLRSGIQLNEDALQSEINAMK